MLFVVNLLLATMAKALWAHGTGLLGSPNLERNIARDLPVLIYQKMDCLAHIKPQKNFIIVS